MEYRPVILVVIIVHCCKGFLNNSIFTAPRWPLDDSFKLQEGSRYDYIVVGAGTAGSIVAARLALNGSSVLLVEAGGHPNILTRIPGLALSLLTTDSDWQYMSVSNGRSCLASQGRQCRVSAGLVLGGSNTIGHMTYIRGNPKAYDDWNITGWSWQDIYPYFLKYEGLRDLDRLPPSSIPYHNTTGMFPMEFFTDSGNAWHDRINEGFQALNFPFNPDVNANTQIGTTKVVAYVLDGERMSVARAYLTNEEVKRQLTVAFRTTATRILLNNKEAQGVRLKTLLREINVFADKEVILSAGYIATPKLLLLSGIGPVNELNNLNITSVTDLPVGKGFADHSIPLLAVKVDPGFGVDLPNPLPLIPYGVPFLQWVTSKQGPLASGGLLDVNTLVNTDCYDFINRTLRNNSNECNIPNIQYINVYLDRNIIALAKPLIQNAYGLNDETFEQISDANVNNAFILFSPALLDGKSRGTVSLRSANPSDPPLVNPNYLSIDDDVRKMVQSLKILEDLVDTPPFKNVNASILYLNFNDCPEPNTSGKQSDEYWSCYARQMTFSGLHGVGTASIGTVVDEQLKVYGISKLRVIDSSVMPRPPHGNSGAAVMAVAEKGADHILSNS